MGTRLVDGVQLRFLPPIEGVWIGTFNLRWLQHIEHEIAPGSIGAKSEAVEALPSYTAGRLGGNQNFFNNSTTMPIGPAEGAALVIIGKRDDARAIDLHLVVR